LLRPRGRLILVDFAPHDATVLGPEHAHRWAGFSDQAIGKWLDDAGLVVGRPVSLPGGALTVNLWRGERPVVAEPRGNPKSPPSHPELFT
jgi:ArsR family transcriptional regulator